METKEWDEDEDRAEEERELRELFTPYEMIEAEEMLDVIQTFDPPGVGLALVTSTIRTPPATSADTLRPICSQIRPVFIQKRRVEGGW